MSKRLWRKKSWLLRNGGVRRFRGIRSDRGVDHLGHFLSWLSEGVAILFPDYVPITIGIKKECACRTQFHFSVRIDSRDSRSCFLRFRFRRLRDMFHIRRGYRQSGHFLLRSRNIKQFHRQILIEITSFPLDPPSSLSKILWLLCRRPANIRRNSVSLDN